MYSYQEFMSDPVSLHPRQHLVLSLIFFILASMATLWMFFFFFSRKYSDFSGCLILLAYALSHEFKSMFPILLF